MPSSSAPIKNGKSALPTKHNSSRYYGLDALRACLMLLGIFLHLSLPYAGIPFRGYYVTSETSALLRFVPIVHLFRMPAFFLLSGFFAGLLWETRSPRQFVLTRAKRVGLVWIVALGLLSLPMGVIGIYNHFARLSTNAAMLTWNAIATRSFDATWLPETQLHLWFLEYLMVFSLVAALTMSLRLTLPHAFDSWTGKMLVSRFRIFLLAIPSAAALHYMPFALIPYPASFVPWFGVSCVYGWFYTVGWLLYRKRDLLPAIARSIKSELAIMPLLIVISLLLSGKRLKIAPQTTSHLLDAAIGYNVALIVWSAIFILIAVFWRIRPANWLPYMADASYWIYLMHYPVAVLMPALLRGWSVSPVLKVGLAFTLIITFELLVYDQFIRYTAIGTALNGVRTRYRCM